MVENTGLGLGAGHQLGHLGAQLGIGDLLLEPGLALGGLDRHRPIEEGRDQAPALRGQLGHERVGTAKPASRAVRTSRHESCPNTTIVSPLGSVGPTPCRSSARC